MTLKNHSIYYYFGDYGQRTSVRIAANITRWLNSVLAKTTCRRFITVGVEPADKVPVGGSAWKLPEMFAVRCYITKRMPFGANYLFNEAGDAVLTVDWPSVEPLQSQMMLAILHEIGHAFGIFSEPYGIQSVTDLTMTEPRLRTDYSWPERDQYWHAVKQDWLHDPMLNRNTKTPCFSWLNSWIINKGIYRMPLSAPMPDLMKVRLQLPVKGEYSIWRPTPLPALEMFYVQTFSDDSGPWVMNWGSDAQNALSWDQYRIVKVYPQEGEPFACGLSIFDVQEAFLRQGPNYVVRLNQPQNQPL